MKFKKFNKKHLGVTAMLSATAIASVFAASAVTGTTATQVASRTLGSRGNHTETSKEKQERQTKMATALASALGTTVDNITAQLNAGKTPQDIIKASGMDEATIKAQLDASREADMKTRLAADVASGKLTQAQADQILADMANHKGGHGGHDRNMNDGVLANVASVLGTTKEALKTQITAGKSIQELLTAAGISEADFRTKMDALKLTEMKTHLAADVASGKLTQAQADQILADMANHKGGHGGHEKRAKTTAKTSPAN